MDLHARGLVFGNFSLSQILVVPEGGELNSKLVGLGHAWSNNEFFGSGDLLNSRYWPPEVESETDLSAYYLKHPKRSEKFDTWCIGCALLEYFTGIPRSLGLEKLSEFIEENPNIFDHILKAIAAQIHPAVAEAIRVCLQLNPGERAGIRKLSGLPLFANTATVAAEIQSNCDLIAEVDKLFSARRTGFSIDSDTLTDRFVWLSIHQSAADLISNLPGPHVQSQAEWVVDNPLKQRDVTQACVPGHPIIYIAQEPKSHAAYSVAFFHPKGASDKLISKLKALCEIFGVKGVGVGQEDYGDPSKGNMQLTRIVNFGLLSLDDQRKIFAQAIQLAELSVDPLPAIAGGSMSSVSEPVKLSEVLLFIDDQLTRDPKSILTISEPIKAKLYGMFVPHEDPEPRINQMLAYFQSELTEQIGTQTKYRDDESANQARQQLFVIVAHLWSIFGQNLFGLLDEFNHNESLKRPPRYVHLIPYVASRARTALSDPDTQKRRPYVEMAGGRVVFSNLVVQGQEVKTSFGEGSFGIAKGGKWLPSGNSEISGDELEHASRVAVKKMKPLSYVGLKLELMQMYEFYFLQLAHRQVGDQVVKPLGILMYADGKRRNAAMVMEACEADLDHAVRLVGKTDDQQRDHIAECRPLLADVAEGMTLAHEYGLALNDFKLQNALVTTGPNGTKAAKLADLGSSLVAGETPASPVTVGGTYPPPEVAMGRRPLTVEQQQKGDVWSFGVDLLNVMAGESRVRFAFDRWGNVHEYALRMFGPEPDRNSGEVAINIAKIRLKFGNFWGDLIADCVTFDVNRRIGSRELAARLRQGPPVSDARQMADSAVIQGVLETIKSEVVADDNAILFSTYSDPYLKLLELFDGAATPEDLNRVANAFRDVIIEAVDKRKNLAARLQLLPLLRALEEGYNARRDLRTEGYLDAIMVPLSLFSVLRQVGVSEQNGAPEFGVDGQRYGLTTIPHPERANQFLTVPECEGRQYWGMSQPKPGFISGVFREIQSFSELVRVQTQVAFRLEGKIVMTAGTGFSRGRWGVFEIHESPDIPASRDRGAHIVHQWDSIWTRFQSTHKLIQTAHTEMVSLGPIVFRRSGNSILPVVEAPQLAPLTERLRRSDSVNFGLQLFQAICGVQFSASEFQGHSEIREFVQELLENLPRELEPVKSGIELLLYQPDGIFRLKEDAFGRMADALKSILFDPNELANRIQPLIWKLRLLMARLHTDSVLGRARDEDAPEMELLQIGKTGYRVRFERTAKDLETCNVDIDSDDVGQTYMWPYFTSPMPPHVHQALSHYVQGTDV